MSSIVRAISPEVSEPPAGTWSNCLVVGGIAYLAGMTARGIDQNNMAGPAGVLHRQLPGVDLGAGGGVGGAFAQSRD